MSNILSPLPVACLSRSRAVHSDSISTTPFLAMHSDESCSTAIFRKLASPRLHQDEGLKPQRFAAGWSQPSLRLVVL